MCTRVIGNIGTWWHIYMGNGGTIWWETSANEVTINMGNFVRKGTMQWETLAHEGYTDMRDTLARETCSHDGHTLGTLTLAHDGHIDIGNFAQDRHNRWAIWVQVMCTCWPQVMGNMGTWVNLAITSLGPRLAT